ncbi:MAG TPA: phosphopantetheine-binding protein [Burkholderiales bacterium]|nr:phosphopantetheine-binding protein [Burkholderiales bacterium]
MSNGTAEVPPGRGPLEPHELELAQLIVTALNLEVPAAGIDPDAPLYSEGLGLDSIDILEVALVISKTYGVKVRSDDENNSKIFSSLRVLASYIQEHRTK